MFEIIFIILGIFLAVKFSDLSRRIEALEKRNAPVQNINITPPQNPNNNVVVNAQPVAQPVNTQAQIQQPQFIQTDEPNKLIEWLKDNWILKIGVFFLLAGFGWFVSYAFAHDWIGPAGRIALGLIAGTLITLFGAIRLTKSAVQGNTFTILGSALVIISNLAGQYYYGFFSPQLSLFITTLVVLLVSMLGIAYNSKEIVVYGLIIAMFSPTFSGILFNHSFIAVYLLVVSVAFIWIAVFKNWRELLSIGIVGILYNLMFSNFFGNNFIEKNYTDFIIVSLISLAYIAISSANLAIQNLRADGNNAILVIVNTLIIYLTVTSSIPTNYQSLIFALWMVIFAVSGVATFIKSKNEVYFYLNSLAAIFLLGTATAIELNGPALVFAFALEAAIITVISYIVSNQRRTAVYFSFLNVIPIIMSIDSMNGYRWSEGIWHSDFAVLFVMMIVTLILGVFFKMTSVDLQKTGSESGAHHFFLIVSSLYLFILVWLVSGSVLVSSDNAVLVSLLFYSLFGLIAYFVGLIKDYSRLKQYGAFILIMVIIRVLLIDVWRMELSWRIATFITLGVLFISTAFISKNKKHLTDNN